MSVLTFTKGQNPCHKVGYQASQNRYAHIIDCRGRGIKTRDEVERSGEWKKETGE